MKLVTWKTDVENDGLPISQVCPDDQLDLFLIELLSEFQIDKSCLAVYQIGEEIPFGFSD